MSTTTAATLASVPEWHEDFRQDLTHIDVPTLVILRGRGPDCAYRRLGITDCQTDPGSPLIGSAGWAALHYLDPHGRSEPRTGELSWGI
jgi:hypothetical protein